MLRAVKINIVVVMCFTKLAWTIIIARLIGDDASDSYCVYLYEHFL